MYSLISKIAIVIFLVAALGTTTQLPAEVILPDLPEGSLYQLIFATAEQRDATSTDIADYNTFVSQQAALSSKLPHVTWSAVASTSTVDAKDNAVTYTDVPIYNTRGELIASGTAELWSGSIQNPVGYDQYGLKPSAPEWTFPYTGTNTSGASAGSHACMGGTNPEVGQSDKQTGLWISGGSVVSSQKNLALYALSSRITALGVPEPSTLTLCLTLGGMGLIVARRRRKQIA